MIFKTKFFISIRVVTGRPCLVIKLIKLRKYFVAYKEKHLNINQPFNIFSNNFITLNFYCCVTLFVTKITSGLHYFITHILSYIMGKRYYFAFLLFSEN